MTKPLLRALGGESVTPAPVWMMRQAGRYLPEYRELRQQASGFLDFCYTPELAVEATLQPIRRFGFDGAILFSDILVVPDALGQAVTFREGEGPVLEPVRSAGAVANLSADGIEGRLAPVYEAVSRVRRDLPGNTTLIGFAGAPWTVALYMVEGRSGTEGDRARVWAYREPDAFAALIDLLVDGTARHLSAQIEAGAEAIQVFESWAGVLSETQFRRWVVEPTRVLVTRLKSMHPDVPVVGFPRGAGPLIPDYVAGTGVDAVSLDHTVPLAWARDVLQPRCPVQGNLDNQLLMAGGPALDDEVARILDTLGGGPFVFNLGHGILPKTRPENVARVVDLVRGRASPM